MTAKGCAAACLMGEAGQGYAGPEQVAQADTSMMATSNSPDCLTHGTCMPLGGDSIWASIPRLPADGSDDGLPIILVLAGMDGNGLFHSLIEVRTLPCSVSQMHAACYKKVELGRDAV